MHLFFQWWVAALQYECVHCDSSVPSAAAGSAPWELVAVLWSGVSLSPQCLGGFANHS